MKNKKINKKGDSEIEKLLDFFCEFIMNFSNVSLDTHAQLEKIFQFILRFFDCSRAYVYEIEEKSIIKLFEISSDNMSIKPYTIIREKIEPIRPYIPLFKEAKTIVIEDISSIQEDNPELYRLKKGQEATSFVYSPLLLENRLIGFIGMDNPKILQLELGENLLVKIVNCISTFLKKQIEKRLKLKVLHYDKKEKTELKKLCKSSLNLINQDLNKAKTLGLVYYALNRDNCDTELLTRESYSLINDFFSHDCIFSLEHKDFLVLCKDCGEKDFYKALHRLQNSTSHLDVIIQSSWKNNNMDFESRFNQLKLKTLTAQKNALSIFDDIESSYSLSKKNSAFKNYTKNNYFDPETLIRSIANPNSMNYIYFGDLQTRTFYISDNMVKKFGFESNVLDNFLELWEKCIYNERDRALYREDIKEILAGKKNLHNLRYRVKDVNGEKIWIHCQGEVLWDEENDKQLFFSGCVTSQEDEYLIDPVTRFQRESFAKRKLSSQVERGSMIRIIGFSLNNFNEINELWGKSKGDKLLYDIARQLGEEYSGKIHFYRLDGLRFAAIFSTHNTDCEKRVIQEIREVILKYYLSHNVTVQAPCSFCYMTADPKEMDVQDMISNTVLLINIAKSSMEDNFIAYSAESVKEKKHYAEMVLEITRNIKNNFENFRLVIQPTFSAKNQSIRGGEALLRWKFKGTNIPPTEFIPILEKTKLIHTVGRWVLKNVVEILTHLLKIREEIKLSFNVSYTQIYDEDFFHYLSKVLSDYGVDASSLALELTETNFNENPQKLSDFFNTCISHGLNVALDDFGSGYSSIGLLLKYPTSIVKLDKSLLYEIAHSDVNQKFIKSIINSCHLFGKEVCAEGVETKIELDMMREAECDSIQGFYLSRPLELEDFFNLLVEEDSGPYGKIS